MELGLFDQVGDAVVALVPPELGELRIQSRQWGIKVWLDADVCPREHYEAQVIGTRHVPEARVLALEVGFHAENPKPADNRATLERILRAERSWRKPLGPSAVAGSFLGRDGWTRVSEVWLDPDLSDPDVCFELADRLVAYLVALEPARIV